MLSFWPSLSLLVLSLVILLECRAIAGRVTLPLDGFLTVFCYGAIGAPLLALLIQQIPIFSDASLMAWLIGPPIEELAKALPVIVLAFLTREARRLSIADLTLIGFASGAGFGFVEGNLDAIVNGTLPGLTHLAALGLQTGNGAVFFAGHAVATALVGLAAGIGLRFLPPRIAYAWAPAAFVILWMSFDHGIYNWKLLHTDGTGALPTAHVVVELLHALMLKGQLATWVLLAVLIAAQFFEAYLCSKAVGARRDLLLAREWRPWVANEWLVVLLRAPLGRAAFGQTLAYFRLRRAFYLASFEARRDPSDPSWTRHARALEERLKRERSILFDPPPGTWLLPFPVLKTYAAEWTWRMRWVLPFSVLFVLLFLVGPQSLPDGLRQFLYGEPFTMAVVATGLVLAIWRIVLFVRMPPPDPLAAEGAACAGYYTQALLLACSLVCGLFPAAALLLGWKAFAPGAAFLSGYLPGWIGQGGNLQTLLGLGAIGSAVAPDPRPAGEAYRHEIAAADERIRHLALEIEDTTGAAETVAPGSARPLELDAFLGTMAKLDAERDAQARRQLVLDECERHAGEATVTDPAPAAQAVKDEFERLAGELLDAAAKELDAIAALEQAYGRAWAEIMQDLDAHDVLRRKLSAPLRANWRTQGDIGWALRVVEATDEGLLPMQLTLLPDLRAVATSAQNERADIVGAGIERICEAASQYGEDDPFAFAGAEHADDDEAALLAEFASGAPSTETPKAFGLRTPEPIDAPAAHALDPVEAEPPQPAPNRVQNALDQLIGSTGADERYLETIKHLERSTETLRQPIEPIEPEPRAAPAPAEEAPAVSRDSKDAGELEDLLDAIKRDSGYLDFAKDKPVAQADDERVQPEPEETRLDVRQEPAVADDPRETPDEKTPVDNAVDEPIVASAPAESNGEPIEREETVPAPEPLAAAHAELPVVEDAQTADDALALQVEAATPSNEPAVVVAPIEPSDPQDASAPHTEASTAVEDLVGVAPLETSERAEREQSVSEHRQEFDAAPSDKPAVDQLTDYTGALEFEAPTSLDEPVAVTPAEPAGQHEPEKAARATDATVVHDVSAEETAAAEAFALLATDEPADNTAREQPAAAPVAFDESGQLALSLPVSVGDEPRGTEAETQIQPDTSREEEERVATLESRLERTEVKEPATAEPHVPAGEVTHPRESDEPQAKTEVRTSLFARLFESIKRQSTEEPARRYEPKPVDTRPAQPVTPSAEHEPRAFEPPQLQPDAANASNEIAAPTADWLADLAADATKARTDDSSLERIEWPALNRSTDVDAPPSAPVETPAVDGGKRADPETSSADISQAEAATLIAEATPIEPIAATDDAPVTSATDETKTDVRVTIDAASAEPEAAAHHIADAAETAVVANIAEPVEPEASAHDTAVAAAADEPEAVETTLAEPIAAPSIAVIAPADTGAPVEEPERPDEFGSKADRLSYLLSKLEQAIQAKTGASPAPNETPAVSLADPVPSAPVESPSDRVPQAPASKIEEPLEEVDVAARTDHADQTATSRGVSPATSEQPAPTVETQSTVEEPVRSEVRVPNDAPTEVRLKPDRLSFFLDKLFDTTKRETVERPVAPQPAEPESAPVIEVAPPADAAPTYPIESEILDLRGPQPLPDPPDEPEPAAPAPVDVIVAETHIEPTPSETKSADIDSALPQHEPLSPAPTPVATPAPPAPQSQPNEQPATAKRSRSAEPATLFGSRKRPPRGGRAADATSKPVATASAPEQPVTEPKPEQQPAAPQRAPASADAEPASMPRRDWKLARSEPSKPVEAPTTDGAKKPEIRVKTGSGALATTDAAPINSHAATANAPGKSYGPRLAKDEEPGTTPAQQRGSGLAEALTQYYAKTGEPQPAMHTTDRATLQRIISTGKLDAPKRRGAAWSTSGMSRRGEVAIRLKPGAEQFIEFVPSTEMFGQMPHYYPRGVGKGSFATHVPAGHLEYFDITVHQWVPLLRGRE